jgi:hypothetical protein
MFDLYRESLDSMEIKPLFLFFLPSSDGPPWAFVFLQHAIGMPMAIGMDQSASQRKSLEFWAKRGMKIQKSEVHCPKREEGRFFFSKKEEIREEEWVVCMVNVWVDRW